jgi:hypothetical protein
MNNRCTLLAVVLFSLLPFGVANAKTDFHAVLHDYDHIATSMDSAYLIVPPDSPAYATTGWGGTGADYDTFDFPDSLSAWPQRLQLKWTAYGGFLGRRTIQNPLGDTWYALSVIPEGPFVMFYGAGEPSVEELGPVGAPQPCLSVSPSVVTGQITIRLEPVGTAIPVVEIHDAVGNVVRSLACAAGADGIATATWNRKDDRERLVPEGVYFCRYSASDVIAVRKVLVVR